jgi:hypothetical protein
MSDGPWALHRTRHAASEPPPRWRVSGAHWKATANVTKHALGAATASWAQDNGGAAKKGTGGTAAGGAAAGSYSPPGSGEPDHCFAPSPWGYQWVCG